MPERHCYGQREKCGNGILFRKLMPERRFFLRRYPALDLSLGAASARTIFNTSLR